MQHSGDEGNSSAVPLFDVIISMPPGVRLETIQKLAEAEASLPPERLERLISVLRSTPHAKVGAGLSLERAEEEKARFTKAGLLVEITPLIAIQTSTVNETIKNSQVAVEESIRTQVFAEHEKRSVPAESSPFKSKAVLLISTTLVIVMGLLYVGENKIPIGGMSLPWSKKGKPSDAISAARLEQVPGAATTSAGAVPEQAGEADVDDLLIQAAGSSSGAGAAASGATDTIPKPAKQLLTAEFASMLAEIGQSARALAVFKVLATGMSPPTDPQATVALQTVQVKLQAWSVQRMDGSQARLAAEELKAKTQGIANALERAQLQGQVAVILSRNTQLTFDVMRGFLSMGAESLKAVANGQSSAVPGDLTISVAEVILSDITARAKAGLWSTAKASAAQVEDLLKQATDPWTQARLYAVDYQAKMHTGQTNKAAKSLESALALAGKNSNLVERAVWLRGIAQLSDASTQEQFEVTATALQNQLNAKSGIEKARGLTELSLLYTAAGLPGKSSQLRSLAQATGGLSAADSVAINTDLTVRSDIAMAKSLHGLGRYAEAEVVLQRVGGYLF